MQFFRSAVFLMFFFMLMNSPATASGVIKVTHPAHEEHWLVTTTETISWRNLSPGMTGMADIVLQRNDGTTQKVATGISLAAGTLAWEIKGKTVDPGKYRIQVVKTSDNSIQGASEEFSIDPINIDLISPGMQKAQDSWVITGTYDIAWRYPDVPGKNVRIVLDYRGKEAFSKTLADNVPIGRGVYKWEIDRNTFRPGMYFLKVISTTDQRIQETERSLQLTAPIFQVLTPKKEDTWAEGEEHEIRWSYTGRPGQFVQIELERPSGEFRKTNYLSLGRYPIGVNGKGSCKYKFNKGYDGPWKIEMYVENDKWYHGPTFSVVSK